MGFEFTIKEYHTIQFPNDHLTWENMWFTHPFTTSQVDSPINIILFGPSVYPKVQRQRRRIASLFIPTDQMDTFSYADKGRKTSTGFPPESNTYLPSTLSQCLRNQGFDSQISMESSRNAWAVVSWLSEGGYREMINVDKRRKAMLEIKYQANFHQKESPDLE